MGRGLQYRIIILCVALLVGACGELTPPSERREQVASTGVYTVRPGDTLYSIAWGYGLDHREVAAWNNISPPFTIHPGEQLRMSPPALQRRIVASTPPENLQKKLVPSSGNASKNSVLPGYTSKKSKHIPVNTSKKPIGNSSKKPASSAKSSKNKELISKNKTQKEVSVKGKQDHPDTPITTKDVGDNEKMRTSSLSAIEKQDPSPTSIEDVMWRWPTAGRVAAKFDPDSGKKGIDITGLSGQSIFSAAAGDVVYSGSGLLGYGNLVIIKHDDAYLSAYGHNSQLLVKEGDKVAAGQEIAKMGVSPKDGALLHFEIRREGKPVDPTKYLPKKN